MGHIFIKDENVDFGPNPSWAGARILEVLKQLAPTFDFDIVITSARDGKHSGPADPHHEGSAYDIRTKTLTLEQKMRLVKGLQNALYREPRMFYAFLEDAGGGNEHCHVQRRNGMTYGVKDYLISA